MNKVYNLFDLVKVMFNSPSEYKTVSNSEKIKHAYMINFIFSIKYPIQAEMFNGNSISKNGLVDSWQIVTRKYNRIPYWIYKVGRKKKTDSDLIYSYMNEYITEYQISKNDYYALMSFYPEELILNIKQIKRIKDDK